MGKDRYMYIRDGWYGSLSAVSMADARAHLPRKTLVVKAKLGEDFAYFVDSADQEIRKAIFDGVRTPEELDFTCPGWRTRNDTWMLDDE